MSALKQSEGDFQGAVIQLAQLRGYLVAHFRPAKTDRGWRTPVSADGAGFPDLVMVGHGRVLYRELKAESGRVRSEQAVWLAQLERCGADCAVWRPSDWPRIEADL